MFQLKLQEFEFIRKTAENIFFVAHRHFLQKNRLSRRFFCVRSSVVEFASVGRRSKALPCGKIARCRGMKPGGTSFNTQNPIPHKSQKTKGFLETSRAKEC